MKRFFGTLGMTLGSWIMWIGLFAIICPFLFPIPMFPELKNIFNIVVFVFPIGFVIRFLSMYDKDLFERLPYLVRDIFFILILVAIPATAVPVAYAIYQKDGYLTVVKGLILIAIGIVGYILLNYHIRDKKRSKRKKQTEE